MRKLAPLLVIGALAAVLSGCLGDSAPDFGEAAGALRTVDSQLLPADLMSCDAFYGDDWDTPDALIGVKGHPNQVVLMQAGEMVCMGGMNQLNQRLQGVDLGNLVTLAGENDSLGIGDMDQGDESADAPVNDSNPLPATPVGGESADAPVDDSNPLPATPVGGESADAPVDDSNPLPATPVGGGSVSSPVDDSNPLPAQTSTTPASKEIGDLLDK